MDDKIYNFMDYWVYLRQITKSSADEAFWIILDDIEHAEEEYLWYHQGKPEKGFSKFLEDCKSTAKIRIRYEKNKKENGQRRDCNY